MCSQLIQPSSPGILDGKCEEDELTLEELQNEFQGIRNQDLLVQLLDIVKQVPMLLLSSPLLSSPLLSSLLLSPPPFPSPPLSRPLLSHLIPSQHRTSAGPNIAASDLGELPAPRAGAGANGDTSKKKRISDWQGPGT
eukprot:547389-Hanusia_phi.AAC.2